MIFCLLLNNVVLSLVIVFLPWNINKLHSIKEQYGCFWFVVFF